MATIAWVVFKHHKKADGTYNPKIRVYHKGTTAYISTPIFTPFVRFKRGESTGTVTNGDIIDSLNERVKAMRKILNKFDNLIDNCENAKSVVAFLDRKMNRDKDLDFIQFAEKAIDEILNNGTKLIRMSLITKLKEFVGESSLPVTKITFSFLTRFESWLTLGKEKDGMRKGLKASTVKTYMESFRAIYNKMLRAYNDYDAGDIVITGDPFKIYQPVRKIQYRKKAVDAEVIRMIASYTPSKGGMKMRVLARDMFLLSFGLAGMNMADIYTCKTFTGNRIEYCRTKTKNKKADGAFMSVPVMPEIQELFNCYRDPSGSRVFNLYKSAGRNTLLANISYGMRTMCRDLGIEPITFYAARHSFATIARNDCNVSMEDIALCLTHRSGFDITDTYVKPDFSRVDRVIRKVLDFVFHPEKAETDSQPT